MTDNLEQVLKKSDSLPFMFVGSGFSKRYLNTPDWKSLLMAVAERVDDNPYYFGRLESIVSKKFDENKEYNSYMTYLCDLISDDLDNLWFTDAKFKNTREKYGDLVLAKKIPPIKVEIVEIIDSKNYLNEVYSEELDSLKEITYKSVAGLITTNYDNLLEEIFEFVTYNSQNDLLFSSNLEVGEIYKIHGSVSDPNSIMINSRDYENIKKKDKYLAAKLLTIFIEHPIIFIGYSIGDEDIRNILESITDCLEEDQKAELQKRLIFIEWDSEFKGIAESTLALNFSNNETLKITKFTLNDFTILYKLIASNKSELPVKTLRKLKHSMYNLTLTNDTKEKVYVQRPDEIIENDNFEIIAGFGIMELARRGYGSIHPMEIYRDVILNDGNFNTHLLVQEALSDCINKKSGYLPFWKYLVGYSEELPEIVIRNMRRFHSFEKLLPKSLENKKAIEEISFEEATNGPNSYDLLAIVDYNISRNIELLQEYLKEELLSNRNILDENTAFRRLVRIYDYVRYKQ